MRLLTIAAWAGAALLAYWMFGEATRFPVSSTPRLVALVAVLAWYLVALTLPAALIARRRRGVSGQR